MNPTLNERLKAVARLFVYIVLVIFLVRNVLDVVRQVTSPDGPDVPHQQTTTSNEVPDTAKSVAKLFLENWYSVRLDQSDDSRIEHLKPFVTPSLFDFINKNTDFSISNEQNSIITPQSTATNVPNATNTTNKTTNTTNQQQGKFQGVSAKEVDVWQATWKNQKAGQVQIIARLVSSDDKVLFLSLPVTQSGNTWQVSSLPSLVAEPKGSDKIEEDSGLDIKDKEDAIKTVLDSFFTDWLAGNSEAIKRYMADGKPIATTNWLEKLNAQYQGVQSITPISENPLKVKVVIMIKDQNNVTMLLDYFMTLEEKNGSWNIDSID